MLGEDGGDVLIAATVSYYNESLGTVEPTALDAILAEWTSGRICLERSQNLSNVGNSTFGHRSNGHYLPLASGPGKNVFDDDAVDTITSGPGNAIAVVDWSFANTAFGTLDLHGKAASELIQEY